MLRSNYYLDNINLVNADSHQIAPSIVTPRRNPRYYMMKSKDDQSFIDDDNVVRVLLDVQGSFSLLPVILAEGGVLGKFKGLFTHNVITLYNAAPLVKALQVSKSLIALLPFVEKAFANIPPVKTFLAYLINNTNPELVPEIIKIITGEIDDKNDIH